MRESLGGAMLLNLVVIFTGLVIVFFIGILSYSKAYRVKNRIIEIIEKHEGYNNNTQNEISSDLKNAGYSAFNPTKCDSIRKKLIETEDEEVIDEKLLSINRNNSGYNYCVFHSTNSMNGDYYIVVTFIHFEFPIIGDVLTLPVYGETKILNQNYE